MADSHSEKPPGEVFVVQRQVKFGDSTQVVTPVSAHLDEDSAKKAIAKMSQDINVLGSCPVKLPTGEIGQFGPLLSALGVVSVTFGAVRVPVQGLLHVPQQSRIILAS